MADLWNAPRDEGASGVFALKPKWVHERKTDAYFSLHPEERKYLPAIGAA